MKAFFAILGLASLASAGGGGYNYHTGTTIYETTTVCPITQTYTTSGSYVSSAGTPRMPLKY